MKEILYDVIGLALIALLIATFILGTKSDSVQGILSLISTSNLDKLGGLL